MPSPFGEFDLIAAIRRRAAADPRVPVGIGDDAAVLAGPPGGRWLVAADMLLEGRHFDARTATPRRIGRKALAVNLSDIAAMAGRPAAAFVTVAHRREYGAEWAEEVHVGLQELADGFGVVVAGGDTNVWDGPVVVSVTLLGEVVGDRAVMRSGAEPGDRVFVTGPLGGSLPTGRHLTFTPRVTEALALHAAVDLHAMIDVSDGLLADLGHVTEESGVGVVLRAESIPLTEAARTGDDGRSPLERGLTDGEDFELAFCVSDADADRLRRDPPAGVALFEVGEIISGSGVTVLDRQDRPLTFASRGWEHRW
ncbi:MAG TPA: thiamine-phosphate kinase [Planctomycetaceae bacterium]